MQILSRFKKPRNAKACFEHACTPVGSRTRAARALFVSTCVHAFTPIHTSPSRPPSLSSQTGSRANRGIDDSCRGAGHFPLTHAHAHTRTRTRTRTRKRAHTHTRKHTHTPTHPHPHPHPHTHTHTQATLTHSHEHSHAHTTRAHTRTHACTRTHTHTRAHTLADHQQQHRRHSSSEE